MSLKCLQSPSISLCGAHLLDVWKWLLTLFQPARHNCCHPQPAPRPDRPTDSQARRRLYCYGATPLQRPECRVNLPPERPHCPTTRVTRNMHTRNLHTRNTCRRIAIPFTIATVVDGNFFQPFGGFHGGYQFGSIGPQSVSTLGDNASQWHHYAQVFVICHPCVICHPRALHVPSICHPGCHPRAFRPTPPVSTPRARFPPCMEHT